MAGYGVADFRLRGERGRLSSELALSNVLNRRYTLYGVYADNPKGVPGTPASGESVERFFTPAYPRVASISLAIRR